MSPKAEAQRLARVEKSLRENYFKSCPEGYLVSQAGRTDLNNQVSMRLLKDRTRIVPWINSIHHLDGASVLEIGCGTGSSTVALAERGAVLTAIDIDAASIAVARERCSAYEVAAAFHVASAARLPEHIREQQYEIIIFYASLEHMTVVERLEAISLAWNMLPVSGLLYVIETPNRLWFFDWHTSQLPFFMWLPDDLAFRYSARSPRTNFSEVYRETTGEALLHFLRRGRGVSFHEFEIAIGPEVHRHVVGQLPPERSRRGGRALSPIASEERRYRQFLRRIAPAVNEAFLGHRLDIAIAKDHHAQRGPTALTS